MLKKIVSVVGLTLLALALTLNGVMPTPVAAQNFPGAAGNPSVLSRPGGTFYAAAFFWQGRLISGNSSTGSQSVILTGTSGGTGGLQLTDGTTIPVQTVFSTLTPVIFDLGQGAQETVTPTAVSVGTCPSGNLGVGGSTTCVTFTGSFVNTHGQSAVVGDGSFGLQTAINYAGQIGSGIVSVDTAWQQMGGTNAMLTAAIPYHDISVMDTRFGAPQFWNAQGGLTTLAAPATLTAVTALPSATPVGAYGTGTYFLCISYVDIYGQEGPCSATFSEAGLATGSFIFSPPVASAGAVGYTIYISLTSGTYVLAYKVPLVSQPTVTGVYPASNGVCTLTTVETVTPACAVANTTYAQSGATATVTAITVNTSPIDPQVTTVSSTTVYTPNAGGRTTYVYTPGQHIGTWGMPPAFLPFTIAAAPATVVPTVLGTINIAPGFMNFLGKTLEICGYATTTATASTIENIQFQYDSMGQNTAGKGVVIGNLTGTTTLATTGHISFCEDFQTTVVGATATSGSIQNVGGGGVAAGVDLVNTVAVLGNTLTGAVGSLNLAADARINVIYLHTTATDGAGYTLQSLTAKVLN